MLTPSQPFRLYQGETQFIKSQVSQSFHSFIHFHNLCLERFWRKRRKMNGKAKMSTPEALASRKSMLCQLYSYSMFKKRKPLIALAGLPPGGRGLNFYVRSTPLQVVQTDMTGHCGLRAHLKRIGVADSPRCDCRTAEQTVHHVLQNCPPMGCTEKWSSR